MSIRHQDIALTQIGFFVRARVFRQECLLGEAEVEPGLTTWGFYRPD